MAPPPGYVVFDADEIGLHLAVLMGDGAPTLSGGVGGWEAVARPGHRPLTVWRGPSDPLTMTVPVMFNGYDMDREHPRGVSQEQRIRVLERMAGLDVGDPEPPVVTVTGAIVPNDARNPGNRWVITGLEWGDSLWRPDGHRVRAMATVTLVRFTQDDRLERLRRSSPKPAYRFVRSRPGDTFEKVAARELKLKRAGSRLARLNGKRSPDTPLKKGTRVRLPSADALKTWKHELGG